MCDRSAGSVQSLGEQKKQKQKSVETPKMASLGQREDGGKKQKQKKPLRRVWWDKNTKINKTLPRGLIATIFVCLFFLSVMLFYLMATQGQG